MHCAKVAFCIRNGEFERPAWLLDPPAKEVVMVPGGSRCSPGRIRFVLEPNGSF